MSNKKKDIANDLARGRIVKKPIGITDEEAANVVKKVSKVEVTPRRQEKHHPDEKEKTIRTTLDLPKSVHKALKIKVATDDAVKSIKDYVVMLVKKDLKLK